MTLVEIWRAFAPNLRPRKLDEKLSRHGLGARRVALLAPWGPRRKKFRWGKTCDVKSILVSA